MKARWMGAAIASGDVLTQPGDIGFGAENYHFSLLIRCPVCGGLHVANVDDGSGLRWDWDGQMLTLSPSYLVGRGTDSICHWNLTNGKFVVHGDSTAKMRGA